MIPMALSNAIAVKVGFATGLGFCRFETLCFFGVGISVGFMSLCAFFFLAFPGFFVKVFTSDLQLINICVPIMTLAGIFQIFDGFQVSLGGVFKGIKRTNVLMEGDFFRLLDCWASIRLYPCV